MLTGLMVVVVTPSWGSSMDRMCFWPLLILCHLSGRQPADVVWVIPKLNEHIRSRRPLSAEPTDTDPASPVIRPRWWLPASLPGMGDKVNGSQSLAAGRAAA